MTEGNSPINLSGISKPATLLIQKISNAVGVLYEPKRIVKRAKADAEAQKIKALAALELSEIESRAVGRLIHQEARKQENIEAITAQAIPLIESGAKTENLQEDWIAHFFNQCDTVSDKEMQSLWARMLAGEANQPGTFSKRTVNFVASMDKDDAELFTSFCQFCVVIAEEITPLIFQINDIIYADQGLSFSALRHMESIGLITMEMNSSYLKTSKNKTWRFDYFDSIFVIEYPRETLNKLDVGHVALTQIGKELYPICGAQKNDAFPQYLMDMTRAENAHTGLSITEHKKQPKK